MIKIIPAPESVIEKEGNVAFGKHMKISGEFGETLKFATHAVAETEGG